MMAWVRTRRSLPWRPITLMGNSLGNSWAVLPLILFSREKRLPSGWRRIATHAALRASRDLHFSMFANVLSDGFLVYCMDVQFSISRCSGPAPAGEGQARCVALRLGARGQHGVQLLQRTVGQSVRARAAVFVGIRFLAVPQRGHAR